MSKRKQSKVEVSNIVQTEALNGFGTNELKFVVSGENVNHIFTQTIIRTVLSLVGSFAFSQKNIKFESNTSIFNRDHLRLRISNIPIIYKNYDYETIPDFAKKCVELEKEEDESFGKEISELEKLEQEARQNILLADNIHMYVNAVNNTNDLMYVTTNSKFTTFHKDGKTIPDIYPREVLIVVLKPGQEICFSATADFNVPIKNGIYRAAYKAYHNEIDDNNYMITIKSYRQIHEKRIITEACNIIMLKLENLKNKIFEVIDSEEFTEAFSNKDYEGEVSVMYENHTMAEIFTRRLQDNKFTVFAGFKIDHPDEKKFRFKYVVEGSTIKKVVDNVIESLIEDYGVVGNSIN